MDMRRTALMAAASGLLLTGCSTIATTASQESEALSRNPALALETVIAACDIMEEARTP